MSVEVDCFWCEEFRICTQTRDSEASYCIDCLDDHTTRCDCCDQYFGITVYDSAEPNIVYSSKSLIWICFECWNTDLDGEWEWEMHYSEPPINQPPINPNLQNDLQNIEPAYRTPGNLVDCVELGYCIYCKEHVSDMCLNKICRQKERDRLHTFLEVHFNNEMSKLRSITTDYDKKAECSICMENDCDCKRSCGHVFHRNCIRTWHKNNFSCPVCRNNEYITYDISDQKIISDQKVILIQAYFRGYMSRKKLHEKHIIRIQSHVRGFMTRQKKYIFTAIRTYANKTKQENYEKYIILIQSHVRGFLIRKNKYVLASMQTQEKLMWLEIKKQIAIAQFCIQSKRTTHYKYNY